MIVSFQLIGVQKQMQDSDKDGMPDKWDRFPGKNDSEEIIKERNRLERRAKEAVQDIAGLLVGEYYADRGKFASDHALVKEIQSKLALLDYDIGKTGIDGKLGAKTKTAMHNFEQDHATEMREAARTAAYINAATNKGREK